MRPPLLGGRLDGLVDCLGRRRRHSLGARKRGRQISLKRKVCLQPDLVSVEWRSNHLVPSGGQEADDFTIQPVSLGPMNLPHANACEVVDQLRPHFEGFSLLPYNRFEVEKSKSCYLTATGANPAFHLGKAVVTMLDDVEESRGLIGFSVEKGLGADAAQKPSEAMQDDWFWFHFLKVANQPLADAVAAAEAALDDCVDIQVCGSIGNSVAELRFQSRGGRLMQTSYSPDQGQLSKLASASSFPEFSAGLQQLSEAGDAVWTWIDLTMGKIFSRHPAGPDDIDKAVEMLRPFERWMRHGAASS